MGQLYFFIGNPRSGKSTIANKWITNLGYFEVGKYCPWTKLEAIYSPTTPRVVICGDALRLALHGQVYAKEAEGYIACMMEVMARAYLNEGYDVLIDETNTSVASITRWYRLRKDAIPIWIDTDKEECIARAKKNGQDYLVPVIERCDQQRNYLKENWNKVHAEVLEYLEGHN